VIIETTSSFTGRTFQRQLPARFTAAPPAKPDQTFAMVQDANPGLAKFLRPQSAFQWWTLPYLSALTPQYIQTVLIGALSGNHVPAWQLFDLMVDTSPEIAACIGEYVDGILEKNLIIEPYHEEDEEPSPNAIRNQKIVSAALRNMRPDPANDENALDGTIRDILFARFHGQTVLETDWFDTFGTGQLNTIDLPDIGTIAAPRATFWVHPVCYAYDVTGRLGLRLPPELIQEQSKQFKGQKPGAMQDFAATKYMPWSGFTGPSRPDAISEFPANQFLISIFKAKTGTALGGSALRPLAWWWCVSNFAGDWLLDLAQIFGIPFRKAHYKQGVGEAAKQEAREMLQNMGSRGWCLLDERVDVEFEKAMESGAQSPQGFLVELAEKQFRKVILRQTMTGRDSSTGKGFGTTEQNVKDQCLNAGGKFACSVLREQMARHILLNNLNDDSELPFIRLSAKEEGTLEDAQRDAELAGAGLKIGENYLRKKFNIPRPGKDEPTIGGVPPVTPAPNEPKPGADKNPQKPKDNSDLEAGDIEGHDFHGNQWTEGGGAGAVHTEQFKKWFGDSKIVDDKGAPLRVFHGTTADFDAFDKKHISDQLKGFYFSTRDVTSDTYATGQEGSRVIPVYLSIKNPASMADVKRLAGTGVKTPKIHAALKKEGFDGIVDKDQGIVVAFEPTQIKSAIGNSGAFNPKDKRITASAPLIEAASPSAVAAPTEDYQSKALQEYSRAFAEDVQHVLDRLAKILEIQDDEIFKTKLEQFLKNFPALQKDVLADPAAARALQPIIATALANGLARKSETNK
jgi:phage gp29-like protein